jgi:Domain of unknown function (DUF5655)
MSEQEYFAHGAAFERPIYDAVAEHLEGVGPLTTEFLSVGVQFKRARTFAELRPMKKWVRLWLMMSRAPKHSRIVRTWRGAGERCAISIDLREPDEVDDELKDWMTEAYFASPI